MSSNDQNPNEKSFQVVDKRRFNASGQEREATSSKGETDITQESRPLDSTDFTMKESPSDNQDEPVAFTSFIMSLATQVLVQIGEMKAPSGMEIPVDLEAARQTIDILEMLQKRTKGNLSQDEARFLEDILHSLRMSYVNKKAR